MRKLLTVLIALVALGAGTTLAVATGGGGWHHGGGSGHSQYKPKPGCGPDKTDGYAGKSGRHEGQPPKADDRKDCPNPPGQCKDGDEQKSYGSKSSSKGGSYDGHDDCKDDERCDDKESSKSKSSSSKSGSYGGSYGDCKDGKGYSKDYDGKKDDKRY